jgi:hypothetical protein
MTQRAPLDEREIIANPPLADREDLADQFPVEPKDWDAGKETGQLRLSIKSAEEALARGEVLPKPTFRDIPKELRDLRRMALNCRHYGFMTWFELSQTAGVLSALGTKYSESELKVLLKRYLWILIPEKAYAETLDGSLTELFSLVFEHTFRSLDSEWGRKHTECSTAREISEGFDEFWEALVERKTEFLECLEEPYGKTLKKKFPACTKLFEIT